MNFTEKHKLLKVLSLNSFSVATNFILGLFSVKIVSVFLGASGMALLGNFRSFTTLFKSLSVIGFNEGIIKLLNQKNQSKAEKDKMISSILLYFSIIVIVLMVVGIAFSKSISSYLFKTEDYFLLVSIFSLLLPFFTLQSFVISFFNSHSLFRKIITIQIIGSIVIFLITFYLIYTKALYGALFSIAISDFILFVISFVIALKNKEIFQFNFIKKIDFKYIKSINKFIVMALLSAVLVPITLLLIRNLIIDTYSLDVAGKWEAINRISGFYMMFFSSGLSLYYLPKLSQIHSDNEFKTELKYYFKTLVPIVFLVLLLVYLFKDILISLALTKEFNPIKSILIWQIVGDFFKIMTLAFGYQLVIKTRVAKYVIIELFFNLLYLSLSFYLITSQNITGIVKAYCISSFVTFLLMLFMFKNLFYKNE